MTTRLVTDPTTGKLIKNADGTLRSYDASANPSGPPPGCCCGCNCCTAELADHPDLVLCLRNSSLCSTCFGTERCITVPWDPISGCWKLDTSILPCATITGIEICCNSAGEAGNCWTITMVCNGDHFSGVLTLQSCSPLLLQAILCTVGGNCCPESGGTDQGCVEVEVTL